MEKREGRMFPVKRTWNLCDLEHKVAEEAVEEEEGRQETGHKRRAGTTPS